MTGYMRVTALDDQIVQFLHDNPGSTAKDVKRQFGLRNSTTYYTLRRLETQGCIWHLLMAGEPGYTYRMYFKGASAAQ